MDLSITIDAKTPYPTLYSPVAFYCKPISVVPAFLLLVVRTCTFLQHVTSSRLSFEFGRFAFTPAQQTKAVFRVGMDLMSDISMIVSVSHIRGSCGLSCVSYLYAKRAAGGPAVTAETA
jgi:hypothetical protein